MPYLSTGYFRTGYFRSGYFPEGGPAAATVGIRDEDILQDVITRLDDTREFGQILANVGESGAATDPYPLVIVTDPGTAEDVWIATGLMEHQGEFLIDLVVQEYEPNASYGTINRLERVIKNTLDNVSLAGVTLAWATQVTRELSGKRALSTAGMGGQLPNDTNRRSHLVLSYAYEVTPGGWEVGNGNVAAEVPLPPVPTGYGTSGYGTSGYGV